MSFKSMIAADRWEQGSEFHWMPEWDTLDTSPPWGEKRLLFGSGRHAFLSLLTYGRTCRKWRRLWVPSYFCQEVLAVFLTAGIEVSLYPDRPANGGSRTKQIDFRPGDVLLKVNFFGLRSQPLAEQNYFGEFEVIENHSHDPWSGWARHSRADWCVASLRKTLPVPDGGILWSPKEHPLPPVIAPTSGHKTASLEKLAAMVLKDLYLHGHPTEKDIFRRLAISGEQHLAAGEVSGMTEWASALLPAFPVANWRNRRRRNHKDFTAALGNLPWVTVLQPDTAGDVCPFSVILVFDAPQRCIHVREKLISSQVYPAILWPLDKPVVAGVSPEDRELSLRLLSVHCDMRYDADDMEFVASLIRKYGEERPGRQ